MESLESDEMYFPGAANEDIVECHVCKDTVTVSHTIGDSDGVSAKGKARYFTYDVGKEKEIVSQEHRRLYEKYKEEIKGRLLPVLNSDKEKVLRMQRPLVTMVHRNCMCGVAVLPPIVQSNREVHVQPLADYHRRANLKKPDYIEPEMIPEPDYSDSEGDHENRTHLPRHRTAKNRSPTGVHQMDDDGLILPRKLQNPCMESVERQNLHRELLFNQKIGKNPLRQKSELEKVMEKVREEQKKKELEEERLSRRTALEKRLEEQAKKVNQHDETSKDVPPSKEVDSEFLRVHARVRANSLPLDSKS